MSGVTENGFERETFAELLASLSSELREKIDPRLTLDEKDALGNILNAFTDAVSLAWEAVEASYHSHDPRAATGRAMVALAKLTGTDRRQPGPGRVTATVNLDGGRTYAAGALVAHEDGVPENRWRNVSQISMAATGNVSAIFESVSTGSAAFVAATKLTKIAEAVTGWNSVTNAADSSRGTDLESIEDLRIRRERELQQSGSATLGSIVAAVGNVDGVIECVGAENVTAVQTTIPPHSFQITVYDGNSASDNDIAQAIYENRAGGIGSAGTSSGTATDAETGLPFTERFRRATAVPITIACTIVSPTGVLALDVKNKILAKFEELAAIGTDLLYTPLKASPFEVAGVKNVSSFTVNGGTTDVQITEFERPTLVIGSITVTGDVT